MLVLIWMGGRGFRMSKKRSAEMFVIATLTLIILHHQGITVAPNLKLFIKCACTV
jgi:hypothetical protein